MRDWLSHVEHSWLAMEVIKATLAIEVALILCIAIGFVFAQLSKHLNPEQCTKRTFVFKALKTPLQVFIWVLCIRIIILVAEGWPPVAIEVLENNIPKFLQASMVLCVSWFLFRFMKEFKAHYIALHNIGPKSEALSYANSVHKICEVLLFVVTFLVCLEAMSFPISGILTVGGVGGAAFSIANRQLIANFVTGFMTHLDRPFEVGDFVYNVPKTFGGRVERIGLRYTVIRGRDKRPVYVPNAYFNDTNFVNRSRMTHRRMVQYISLRFEDIDKVRAILADVYLLVEETPEIDSNEEIRVSLIKGDSNIRSNLKGCFSQCSVTFFIMCYTQEKSAVPFLKMQSDLMLRVAEVIDKHGAKIAKQYLDMDIRQQPSTFGDSLDKEPL